RRPAPRSSNLILRHRGAQGRRTVTALAHAGSLVGRRPSASRAAPPLGSKGTKPIAAAHASDRRNLNRFVRRILAELHSPAVGGWRNQRRVGFSVIKLANHSTSAGNGPDEIGPHPRREV